MKYRWIIFSLHILSKSPHLPVTLSPPVSMSDSPSSSLSIIFFLFTTEPSESESSSGKSEINDLMGGGHFTKDVFFSNRPVLDQVVPDESILCKNLNKCLSYEQFNQLSKPYIFHELKLNSFAQQEGSFYYKKVLPFFGLETLLLLDLSIKRKKMKFKLQHFKENQIKNIELHILQCDSNITWSPGSMEKKNHVLTYPTVI